ncbi:MAG: hypothetical protein Q4P06_02940 [Actinomycetaceae bacterium]|nr:hypothetical protein [Actinomycetaceae bacterium]
MNFTAAFSFLKWTPLLTPTAAPVALAAQEWWVLLLQVLYAAGLATALTHLWLGTIGPAMSGQARAVSEQAQAAIARQQWVVDPRAAATDLQSQIEASHLATGKDLPALGLWQALRLSSTTSVLAARTLRDWVKDPRLLASFFSLLFFPAMALLFSALSSLEGQGPSPLSGFVYLGPLMMGMTVGFLVSYDSTAFWIHVAAGISGWQDRWGRFLGSAPLALVVVVFSTGVGTYLQMGAGPIHLFISLLATYFISAALTMSFTGRFSVGAQPPGASPLSTKGTGNQLFTMLIMIAEWALTAALMSPAFLLQMWLGEDRAWIVSAATLGWSLALLAAGFYVGAKVFDRGQVKLLQVIRSWPGH